MTSISFFELGVDDAEKAQAFYGAMFGWEFETGPAMQGYAIKTPGVPGGLHPNDKGANHMAAVSIQALRGCGYRLGQNAA